MTKDRTQFLKFSAYSIKDAITRKLSQDSRFTDQVYEGSNLAILIDLFAATYQCLVYQLNSAASESMWADTQIYENIQRLCSFLGYNVKGCSPASFSVKVQLADGNRGKYLPTYARIETNKTDSNGRQICFSTGQPSTENPEKRHIDLNNDENLDVGLYNGEWRLYQKIFTAAGVENETFVLDGLVSDSSKKEYVAANFIDVYVVTEDLANPGQYTIDKNWRNDQNGIFLNYSNDTSIFNTNNTNIYKGIDQIYSVYLNADKTYELKFGNGVVGAKLRPGDKVMVFYLRTNGPDGELDLDDLDISGLKFKHNAQMFGLQEDIYKKLFGMENNLSGNLVDYPEEYTLAKNSLKTNSFTPEESVDVVRYNAPNWFKTGNRLVTAADYEYFVKNVVYVKDSVPGLTVADVKCMNNIEYVSKFYKWLYLNGLNAHQNGKYYFQSAFWTRTGFKVADPADANNVYLWIKSDSDGPMLDDYDVSQVEAFLNDRLGPVKTMTTEINVVKPVLVHFDVCANQDASLVKMRYLGDDIQYFDEECESYIEITIDNSIIFVSTQIQKRVADIISGYFDRSRMKLGQFVDFNQILKEIYQINGVLNVRTIFDDGEELRQYNGLSFASWSPILKPITQDFDDEGYDDMQIGNSSRQLEPFQFPVFVGGGKLIDRIKVITKSLTSINGVKQ